MRFQNKINTRLLQQSFILVPILLLFFGCRYPNVVSELDPVEIAAIDHMKQRMAYDSRTLGIDLFHEGLRNFGQGNLVESYTQWSRSITLVPDWDLPLLQMAILHPLYDNDREAARQALLKAVSINSENPRTHFMLGVEHSQARHVKEAEAAFLEAIRRKPEYGEAHFRLANLYREQGLNDKAIDRYRRIVKMQPGNILVHSILASLFEQTGQHKLAEAKLKSMIGIQSDPAYAYYKLAQFYTRTGQDNKARRAYNMAQKLKPNGDKRRMRPLLPSRR